MLEQKNRQITNSKMALLMPVRMYDVSPVDFDEIHEEDFVLAKITMFIPPNEIKLKIGRIDAVMDIQDFDVTNENGRIKAVYANLGKNVIAQVMKKDEEKCKVILNRKVAIEETIDLLKKRIGEVREVVIEKVEDFGCFVDLGAGFISLVPIQEMSICRYSNLKNVFEVGDVIQVRIMGFDESKKFVSLSRKASYEKITEKTLPMDSAFEVTIFGYVNDLKDGVFIEFDPNNSGIMDIPEGYDPRCFFEGRKAFVRLKSIRSNGIKVQFLYFSE